MRALELFLTEQEIEESRGVSARQPGDVYVNARDPEDTLTVVEIKFVRPSNEYAFDTREELEGALDEIIPADMARVNDNIPTSATRAAIVAEFERADGSREAHVRYVKDLMSMHGRWKAPAGYKFQAAIETESLPIKPSDIIPDENPRSLNELVNTIETNVDKSLDGTQYEHFGELIQQVVKNAGNGSTSPIHFDKRGQAGIIAKYAGEYSGVVALLSDNLTNMKLADIGAHYDLDFTGARVVFPQDTTGMLIDSYLVLPNGRKIGVSSKMYKAGGAASSLLGIYKIMPPDVARRYPKGATIVKDLAAMPAYAADPVNAGNIGPVVLARQMKIISPEDIEEIERLARTEQNPGVLKSARLKQILQNQGVNPGTMERPDYSVYNHILAAIVNLMVTRVNNEPEFVDVINATLRENSYIQILTKVGLSGNNVTFSYYAKLPDNNKPFVYNKNYFATGNKGRIGFKLEK